MDIKIKTEKDNFKYRVCGILTHNNKYLGVKIADNEFYCLPGGHVEIGEDTDEAILREMEEELGYPIKIKQMVGIAENFFRTKNDGIFHELGFYYLVEAKDFYAVNTSDYELVENDKGILRKLVFKWFTKEEIEETDFRPKFVKELINADGLMHIISKNEKVLKNNRYHK